MSKTTLKEHFVNLLNRAKQKHNVEPVAIYFKEEFSEQLYKWSGETTLDCFLSTIDNNKERYCHCFEGVVWFNNGDYAESYDPNEIESAWNYVVVPKLKDYFIH